MKHELKEQVQLKTMFKQNQTIVVAVSGGVDSMVLFDVLQNSSLSLEIIVCHVNHNQRDESKNEYNFVKSYVEERNAQFEGLQLSTKYEGNFQDYAREKRYTFFEAMAKKYNAEAIVTAHHQDDQVETVLMRLVRGTRFINYRGMDQISTYNNVSLIRPLLRISKDEIYTYAKENSIPYKEDKTNKEDTYTRNRYRNSIIPLLEEENPKVKSKIIQFSELIRSAGQVIEKHTENILKKSVFYNTMSIDAFLQEERIIQYQILYRLINRSSTNSIEASLEQLDAIIEICEHDRPNASITLPNGYEAIREYDYLMIEKQETPSAIAIDVDDVGEVKLTDEITVLFSYEKVKHIDMNFTKIWYNKKVFPLTIRHRKDGDYMQLQVGRKKVKDILIDQKIPMRVRNSLFVIADGSRVRWIPHIKEEQTAKNKNILYIYEVTTC